ncbi:MAG: hypothetical protein VYB51_03485, partial [Gemmatimonadota bacterium]|nr:hypothetical protein [Gemmatimonadota bacterium]
ADLSSESCLSDAVWSLLEGRGGTLKADPTHETIEALQEMFGKARVRLVRVADERSGPDPLAY